MVPDAKSARNPRRRTPALLLCLCVALLPAALPVRGAAAGESRTTMAVTARIVQACSIAAPGARPGRGADPPGKGVDHRCTAPPGRVPHSVTVHRAGQKGQGRTGGNLVVTVTY